MSEHHNDTISERKPAITVSTRPDVPLAARLPIALDVMGGDHAPAEPVAAAVQAARQHGIPVILVGKKAAIERELSQLQALHSPLLTIEDTDETIDMHEQPAVALRQKRRASVRLIMDLVAEGRACAAISAGNSGAIMAAAIFSLKRQAGVDRPAFGTVLPSQGGPSIVVDVGANVDCKPHYLLQFGVMGSVYMKAVYDIAMPRVALLNNGEEAGKGNELTRAAYDLLAQSTMNFVGNVEGNDVALGKADVIVCDGFAGNVFLKTAEGVSLYIASMLRQELTSTLRGRLAGLLALPAIARLRKRIDFEEYGGAPVLGVNGVVLNCHGRSKAKAITNALLQARRMADANLGQILADDMRAAGSSTVATGAPLA